jgi:hypothetical protein
VFVVFLSGLLLFIRCEPTSDSSGMVVFSFLSQHIQSHEPSKLFVPTFELLADAFKEMGEDTPSVTSAQVAMMFVDWTDPQKAM